MSYPDRQEIEDLESEVHRLRAPLAAAKEELTKLSRQLDSACADIEDRDDAIDCLRRIGQIIDCDHADGRDDRARLVRCVREEFERLKAASPPQPAAADGILVGPGVGLVVAYDGEGRRLYPPETPIERATREEARRAAGLVGAFEPRLAPSPPQPAACAAVDPDVPRRFRWPVPDGSGEWHHGVYYPPSNGWQTFNRPAKLGKPAMPGLEWLDPEPAGAVTAGGVTLPSETDGESAAAKLLARVAAIQAVEADRPIKLAGGDDPHGGPVPAAGLRAVLQRGGR